MRWRWGWGPGKDNVGSEKEKKKGKKEKEKIRVLLTFHPFILLGKVILPNDKKNEIGSPNESPPQMKVQVKLFQL